jgi:hypothetical protein
MPVSPNQHGFNRRTCVRRSLFNAATLPKNQYQRTRQPTTGNDPVPPHTLAFFALATSLKNT